MQTEGKKDEWQGYTLVVGWSADEFVKDLKRYAEAKGIIVAPGEASKPDERRVVNLLWPAQGSDGYWPLCRVYVIPRESSLKCIVQVDPGTFARWPEGQQITKDLWLSYCKYLEDLGIEVKMAELADASLDYLGTESYYREPREETVWYDKWISQFLREEIERKKLNEEWRDWYSELYPDVGENPDMGPLRQAIYERRKKLKPSA